MDLERERARRWWLTKRKITRLEQAAAFVADVGFAMLWPAKSVELPALWPIGSSGDHEQEWGKEAQRMWGWKDELPKRGLAWYGPFLRGRKSFLALDLLADLYPRAGKADDFNDAELTREAKLIARIIHADGPSSAAVLREATGLAGTAFSKAATELGRALVITHLGVEEQDAGWPSAVYELTARAFTLAPKGSRDERRRRATRRFLDTMIAARMPDLRYAFNWSAIDARAALDDLVHRGEARIVTLGRRGIFYGAA